MVGFRGGVGGGGLGVGAGDKAVFQDLCSTGKKKYYKKTSRTQKLFLSKPIDRKKKQTKRNYIKKNKTKKKNDKGGMNLGPIHF